MHSRQVLYVRKSQARMFKTIYTSKKFLFPKYKNTEPLQVIPPPGSTGAVEVSFIFIINKSITLQIWTYHLNHSSHIFPSFHH